MVMMALSAPETVGENVRSKVQVVLNVPQVLLDTVNSELLEVTEVTVTFTVPVLVSVIVCVLLLNGATTPKLTSKALWLSVRVTAWLISFEKALSPFAFTAVTL